MRNLLVSLGLLWLVGFSHGAYPVIYSCEHALHSGIYTLQYQGWTLDVECDAVTDGGGWLTLFVRRGGAHDFYRDWKTFSEEGIGSPQTEYVLPLKFWHDFLSQGEYELLKEMSEGSDTAWAFYGEFEIGPEPNKFPISWGNYDPASTNGGFNFLPSGTKFSTYDSDNDSYSGSCSTAYRSANWFKKCHS